MKVLQLFNTGGTPYVFSKELRSYGIESKVLVGVEKFSYDRLWLHLVPEQELVQVVIGYQDFRNSILLYARNYDIIHIHYFDELIPLVYGLGKKIVMTYHGTDIRGKWAEQEKIWELADKVTVTTKDLLEGAPKNVEYVPNPVDTKHFKMIRRPWDKRALYVKSRRGHNREAINEAIEKCKQKDLTLVIQDRKEEIYPYAVYPWVLGTYGYFFDIKQVGGIGEINKVMSLTGLQALSVGALVYHDGYWNKGLPVEHDVKNAVKKWIDIYGAIV